MRRTLRALICGGARFRGKPSSYFTSFTCELTREMKAPRRAAESAAFINLTFPGVYHVNN